MTHHEHDPLVDYLETWAVLRGCTRDAPCAHGYKPRMCWRHVRSYTLARRWARLRRRRMAEMCGTASVTLDEQPHHR